MIAWERLLAGRDLTEPRPSPDGRVVAVVASGAGGAALVMVPIEGGPERQLTSFPAPRPGRSTGGGCFDWLPDGSGVVYAAVDGGLWLQPCPGGDPRCVAHPEAVDGISGVVVRPDGRSVVVVADLERVLVVDLSDGSITRVDDGRHGFVIDPSWSPEGRALTWQGWNAPAMPWDVSDQVIWCDGDPPTITVESEPDATVQQPRIDRNGRRWYVTDRTGWLNVTCDGQPVLREPYEHAGPTWGAGQHSYDLGADGSVAICRNENGFGRLVLVHPDGTVHELGRAVHAQVRLTDRHVVAWRSGARTPTQIVAYDRITAERRVLMVGPLSGWEQEPSLVEPELIEVSLPDESEVVHARLYRSPRPDGRLLCWLHGGPTDQWMIDFRPRFTTWLDRGIDVLVPDHRGSTGHGRRYQQALRGRWGELDVTDTAAMVAHLHQHGSWTPDRTLIMGSSAGGFTALGVVARHGQLVGAAVVLYPVTDLVDLRERGHRFEQHYTDTLVAAPGSPLLVERSPVNWAPLLRFVPLLVMHGDADPVVPVEQSRTLVEAIRNAGGQVEYVEYPGEGHGFRQREHQLDEQRRVAEFCDLYLGGPSKSR